MANRQRLEEALDSFTAEVARREGTRFQSAVLFGSHARGDDKADSDVDVAVILSGPMADFIAAKLALADIAYDVLLETGVHIQPMPLSADQWAHPGHFGNPRLVENIHREGRIL